MGKKNYYPVSTMEYFDWVAKQRFKGSEEHHQYISKYDQDFMVYTIYPMFYTGNENEIKTSFPYPLVSKTYSTRHPKFVINNDYFTAVFFHYEDYFEGEDCWEVSFHIKDHEWCDGPIQEFKEWYRDHYKRLYCEMNGMPNRFIFPKLDLYSRHAEDFCIEFWNEGKDFMLFKLFDLFRIY